MFFSWWLLVNYWRKFNLSHWWSTSVPWWLYKIRYLFRRGSCGHWRKFPFLLTCNTTKISLLFFTIFITFRAVLLHWYLIRQIVFATTYQMCPVANNQILQFVPVNAQSFLNKNEKVTNAKKKKVIFDKIISCISSSCFEIDMMTSLKVFLIDGYNLVKVLNSFFEGKMH